ncbi:VPLPA-CTERM sorting domain-containing protein [Pseudooceanicola sp.]|uniref:VPLPA-CTERM sorting domain-containing protein n=1 Tax=Pseudooceanicola sp. TaxID=1914328 RepID=UPI0035C6E6CB
MTFRNPITARIAAASVLALAAGAAHAGHLTYYEVTLNQLNSSGVTGSGSFTYDDTAKTLSVQLNATGLYEFGPHPQHIHGIPGGDSVSPPVEDADGDGFADIDEDKDQFIELAEAAEFYGPVMVSLTNEDGSLVETPDGVLNYSRVFDLTDPNIYANGFDIDDLGPDMLENREIVLHGGYVWGMAQGVFGEGTEGEVDGTIGYKAVLPVATGEIVRSQMPAVPLPASLPLLVAGFGALGFAARRRRG